jgi:hypothetical protein
MNRHLSGKLIAALTIGLLLGLSFVHSSQLIVRHGRQAFIVAQEHRFDRFTSAPHTFIHILSVIIATCLFLFFYELLAIAAQRVLKAHISLH